MAVGGIGFGLILSIVIIAASSSSSKKPTGLSTKNPDKDHTRTSRAKGQKPRPDKNRKPLPPPVRRSGDDEEDDEENLSPREAFARARNYLDSHPGEYDKAIFELTIILRRYQDFFRDDVEKEMAKVRDKRDEEAEKAYKECLARARTDLDAGRYKDAWEVMQSFPDRFSGSSSSEKARFFRDDVLTKATEKYELVRDRARALSKSGDFWKAIEILEGTFALGIPSIVDSAKFEIARVQRRMKASETEARRKDQEAQARIRAEGEELFRAFFEKLPPLLKARDYDGAQKRIEEKRATTANDRLAALLDLETENLSRLRRVFPLAEKNLPLFEGESVTFRIRGKTRTGTLVRLGSDHRWGLRAGVGTMGFSPPHLSGEDIARLCAARPLDAEQAFALALFLMAEELPALAAGHLTASRRSTPALVQRLTALRRRASARKIDTALTALTKKVTSENAGQVREKVEALEKKYGALLTPDQKRRAEEILIECLTVSSGVRARFRGKAWTLPGDQTRLFYGFDNPSELMDWRPGADGKVELSSGTLQLRKRTVLWSRFILAPPYEVTLRASGDEICINIGGLDKGEWKEGLHSVVGRDRRVVLSRDGARIGSWPLAFERGRTYLLRLAADPKTRRFTIDVDGRPVGALTLGSDPAVLRGRLGLWGFPSLNRFDSVDVRARLELDPADAPPETKPLPKTPIRLFSTDLEKAWTQWRGKWNVAGKEIHAQGRKAALVTRLLDAYRFTDYTFQVEVRRERGQSGELGLVFLYGGQYPLWSFGSDGGRIEGLFGVKSLPHELGRKWTLLRVIARKGKIEGWVGGKRCWFAVNPGGARSALDKCPRGLGLFVGSGNVAFRNPVVTLIK
jgi:tetratricopeptide (TPR) repeat protein